MNNAASTRITAAKILMIACIVVMASCLVVLAFATSPRRHVAFRLAPGPQMSISQSMRGSAAPAPPAKLRVSTLTSLAVSVPHQLLLMPLPDILQQILKRTSNALHRSPPTIRAVAANYRVLITLLCLVTLAIVSNIPMFFAILRSRCDVPAAVNAPTLHVQPQTCNKRALVVEDQPIIAEMIKRRLEGHRLHVTVAHTGAEAITLIDAEGPFELITLDGDLMDRDGSDVAMTIRGMEHRRCWTPARLISISGCRDNGDRISYAGASIYAFLSKPVKWPLLDAAVRSSRGPASASGVRNPDGGATIMSIYFEQMKVDTADLQDVIFDQRWRQALSMAQRIQGAASVVGDTTSIAMLCELQICLKVHAINGDPSVQDVLKMVDLLARLRETARA